MTSTFNGSRTAVKICGIRTLSDGRAAAAAGADYLGFNFYPRSARCIDVRTCAEISAVIKAEYPQVRLVGVFVDAPAANILPVLDACGLDLAQLHGDEPPEMLAQLARRAFKALRGVPSNVADYLFNTPPACLIDAAVRGAYGGTGALADWASCARLARRSPIFLAGGLTPDNVADAIRRVRPWGVDTASGVEIAPGVKDPGLMRAFVQAVRLAETACNLHVASYR